MLLGTMRRWSLQRRWVPLATRSQWVRWAGLHVVLLGAMGMRAQSTAARAAGAAPQLQARDTTGERPVVLEVVVHDQAGRPAAGFAGREVTLRDNRKEVAPALPLESGGSAATQIEFVIDAVNSTLEQVARSEDQVEAYLRLSGGVLARPTAVMVVSDAEPKEKPGEAGGSVSGTDVTLHHRQLFVHRIPASTDGAVLAKELEANRPGLHRILAAQGGVGESERVRLSLEALSFLGNAESSAPGAKLVIWVSPGWPLLARTEAKTQEQLFASVVYFSDLLRSARMVLYAVSPEGVVGRGAPEAGGLAYLSRPDVMRATGHAASLPEADAGASYASYLKGAKSAKHADANDLALQVLAVQSGGLALARDNDLGGMIARCAADASALYSVTYVPAQGAANEEYHAVELSLPGAVARTRAGFYSR